VLHLNGTVTAADGAKFTGGVLLDRCGCWLHRLYMCCTSWHSRSSRRRQVHRWGTFKPNYSCGLLLLACAALQADCGLMLGLQGF
jgi:hypothetical protein